MMEIVSEGFDGAFLLAQEFQRGRYHFRFEAREHVQRPALPEPEPGAAAKKLLAIMRKLPKRRGVKTQVSRRVKAYLYGPAVTKR